MHAIGYQKYGGTDVLQEMTLPRPEPGRDQVRVRVRAAALNPVDCEIREGALQVLSGWNFPRVPGSDFAGIVDAVGENVKNFAQGDRVYGFTDPLQGGSYAEYLVIDAGRIAVVPEKLSLPEAAAVPLAAQTALQALRDLGRIEAGRHVFIHGASGGVGTLAVPIAKACGARVTASCSYRNLEMVRTLGADAVVDYTKRDLTRLEEPFDLYFDVYGNMPFPRVKHLLKVRGRHVSTIPAPLNFAWHFLTRLYPGKQARVVVVRSKTADLQTLNQWIETGQLVPTIDKIYPLSRAAEAQEYLETRRARGKIILTTTD